MACHLRWNLLRTATASCLPTPAARPPHYQGGMPARLEPDSRRRTRLKYSPLSLFPCLPKPVLQGLSYLFLALWTFPSLEWIAFFVLSVASIASIASTSSTMQMAEFSSESISSTCASSVYHFNRIYNSVGTRKWDAPFLSAESANLPPANSAGVELVEPTGPNCRQARFA